MLRTAKDGRQYRCRACSAAAKKGQYQRAVERPKVEVTEKRCPTCGETKPASEFYKNRGTRDGLQGYCKPCHGAHQRRTQDLPRKQARQRSWMLKNLYGITVEQYDAMLTRQGGGCAICHRTEKLHVDHCHDSSRVRGVLCENCNRGIGMFKDDPALLQRAIDYLNQQA